jgi:hypothetical protein
MQLPPAFSRIIPGDFALTTPIAALLAANLVTIVLAIVENWDPATVIFIYWTQSVIIGIFAVIALLSADTADLAADMGRLQAEEGGSPVVGERHVRFYKAAIAGFFALHYGLFHWGYYEFIVEGGIFGPVDFSNTGIWVSCGLFFLNHLYSYVYFRGSERQGAEFMTGQFIRPYNRIIPMHMTIIFGSIIVVILEMLGFTTVMPVLVIFLIIKTRSDIMTHLMKHQEKNYPGGPARMIDFY